MSIIGLLIIGFQLLICALVIGLLLVRPDRLARIPHAPLWSYGLRMLGAIGSLITGSVYPFAWAALLSRSAEAYERTQRRRRQSLMGQIAMGISLLGSLAVLITGSGWLLLVSEVLPWLILLLSTWKRS